MRYATTTPPWRASWNKSRAARCIAVDARLAKLKESVLAEIAKEPSPTRGEVVRSNVLRFVAAAACCAAVLASWGGVRIGGVNAGALLVRPATLLLATAAGATAIAATATWLAASRGASMRGRRLEWLAAIALTTPVLLFAWKVGVSEAVEGMTLRWPERPGFRCMRLGILSAMPPGAALFLLPGATTLAHPRATGLALGAAAGAWAWVVTDLWCPVAYAPHLLLGHVVPLSLAAAAGWMLAPLRR